MNKTIINCVWEHNGDDTLLYTTDYVGAYARGENLEAAMVKMPQEIASYCKWCGKEIGDSIEIVIVQEKESDLAIRDADSDVLFKTEKAPLSMESGAFCCGLLSLFPDVCSCCARRCSGER